MKRTFFAALAVVVLSVVSTFADTSVAGEKTTAVVADTAAAAPAIVAASAQVPKAIVQGVAGFLVRLKTAVSTASIVAIAILPAETITIGAMMWWFVQRRLSTLQR